MVVECGEEKKWNGERAVGNQSLNFQNNNLFRVIQMIVPKNIVIADLCCKFTLSGNMCGILYQHKKKTGIFKLLDRLWVH